MTYRLLIPVTPGELLDRITILRIKLRRIEDRAKLAKVGAELHQVTDVWDNSPYAIRMSAEIIRCWRELQAANEDIWDAENEIRASDNGFISEPAKRARDANNKRTELKARINEELGLETSEVKEYKEV